MSLERKRTMVLFLSTTHKGIVNRNLQGPPCHIFSIVKDYFLSREHLLRGIISSSHSDEHACLVPYF